MSFFHVDGFNCINNFIQSLCQKSWKEHTSSCWSNSKGYKGMLVLGIGKELFISLYKVGHVLMVVFFNTWSFVQLLWIKANNHEAIPTELKSKIWEIHIGGSRIINRMENRLREWIHDPKLNKWWTKNKVMIAEVQQRTSWEAIRRATKTTSRQRKLLTTTKLLSNNAATNNNLKAWGFRKRSHCPLCGRDDEDGRHPNQCQHHPSDIGCNPGK